ncbi:hypothetical protein P3T37_002763 [Kitasatospora sp. MAA4]|uniref:hypothetical protein n=1 Tax=Kitasatospora sp. MAA4 TaxID=3035093 RepID=UPI00247354A2|nr:hypothetical protein [Kitasatospora sp. MAA4]MDH6133368.1 hypothetical protein [Kitasatospora sp. MAA4]
MNLDFSNEPLFSWYVLLLGLSGLVLIGLAAAKGGQSTGMRVFNAIVGAAFLGYGFYLGFIFQGGTYYIFFKVLLVPVLLIVNFVKSLSARSKANAPVQFQPAQPGQPGQPFQPAQPNPYQTQPYQAQQPNPYQTPQPQDAAPAQPYRAG